MSERRYNHYVSSKTIDGTPIMRNPCSLDKLIFEPAEGVDNLQKLVLLGHSLHKDRDFIGSRDLTSGKFTYEKYDSIIEKAHAIGSALSHLGLLQIGESVNGNNLKMIGIYSRNRPEWTISDIANALFGYTMIPLYDSLGPESVSYVLEHSMITACICSSPSIETLSKTAKLHQLKTIIALDSDVPKETIEILKQRNVSIISFGDLIQLGKQKRLPLPTNITPETIFSFSYTSGTTGNPKGAMVSHRNILGAVTNHQLCDFRYRPTDVHLSYLPLPHIFERFVNATCWFSGTKIAFFGGNTLKLREDIADSKSTVLIVVPRILQKFCDEISAFTKKSCKTPELYEKAVAEKLKNISTKENYTLKHDVYDKEVFGIARALLGGNLRCVVSGSAPANQKMLDLMKVHLSCPFYQGYGQTEATALETVQFENDIDGPNVGGILPSLELKLQDVEGMGYTSNDKDEQGRPCPRGEICVRGHSVLPGYYKDPEKTAETFDQEGWMHSGDIGQILPNGALRIIDRKKNIFKLSQGEYLSPEKVEAVYIHAKGVQEVFLHGDSMQSYCVAIIVPKPDEIVKIAAEIGVKSNSIEDLCKDSKVVAEYLKNITEQGKKSGLLSFEQAKKIFLEPKSLALHGCLTSSFKLQRHIAKACFKNVIDILYQTPSL